MVNCTNSANGQLPRGKLHKIGEQLTTAPYKKVNRSKLTHDEEFWYMWSWFLELWLRWLPNKGSTWLLFFACVNILVYLNFLIIKLLLFTELTIFLEEFYPEESCSHFWGRIALLAQEKSSEYLSTSLLGCSRRSPLDPLWLEEGLLRQNLVLCLDRNAKQFWLN